MSTHTLTRLRHVTWLVAGLLLTGAAATACSSAGATPTSTKTSQPASASPTSSATGVNLANVTLHVGDQAGAGAQSLLTAAGLINKLPFKVAWSDFTAGPPMLQAMSAGAVAIGSVGDAPPSLRAAGGSRMP